MDIIVSAVKFGLIYSLAALGFAFSLKILSFADLTAEGSFVLGGVISAILLRLGTPPLLTIVATIIAGCVAGCITSSLHCICHVNKLLSGIITLSILYTLNLRIQGSANYSFYRMSTIFSSFQMDYMKIIFILLIVVLYFAFFYWILQTKFGLLLRICGKNLTLLERNGYNKNIYIYVGLCLANSAISLSGALFSQYAGFSDINNAGGLIVVCLATIILGEILIRPKTIQAFLFSIIIGSILSQAINGFCLFLNFHPADYKGIVGIVLVFLIVFKKRFLTNEASRNAREDYDVEISL